MGNILIFLQHDNGVLPKVTLSAIRGANYLREKWRKKKVLGLCLGVGSEKAAEEALCYGLDRVIFSTQSVFEKYLSIPYASAVTSVCKEEDCDVIVCSATSMGKDFSPRVAVALDAGQASEVIAVNEDGSLRRLMYAGDVVADIEICSKNKIVTLRSTAFLPAEKENPTGEAVMRQFSVPTEGVGQVTDYQFSESDYPDLFSANCVVSGGRALRSEDGFKEIIFPLAKALGGAVGASRAAVDSGFAPNDWQVGQTGKIVAPQLYIAVGISGAIQHLAGMKDSSIIVAINKNEEAPIFDIADYGLVADLYEVVPKLLEEIKKVKAMNP